MDELFVDIATVDGASEQEGWPIADVLCLP
jgi:hypothetical protein